MSQFDLPCVLRQGLAALLGAVIANLMTAQSAPTEPAEPIALVARAEDLCAKGAKEEAILLLWTALERFGARMGQPTTAAGIAAADALLRANDPLHVDRQAAFLAQARARVDLASFYRGKKWFTSATEQLDLADAFDAAVGQKERAQIARANPPALDASIAEPKGYSLLRRVEAVRVEGPWRETSDGLECGAHVAKAPWYEWTIDARHEDCELTVAFRSSDPKAAHDCALLVGLDGAGFYYHFIAAYYPDKGRYDLVLFERNDPNARLLGSRFVGSLPAVDGFHRMSLRVHGASLRAQLDSAEPIEVTVAAAPRGRFGVTIGIENQDSAPITLRDLRVSPWPPLAEADERANAVAAAKKRIAESIDGADLLIRRKEPESAARRLLVARRDAERLPPGPLRDSFIKSIDEYLAKADPLQARAKKVGQDGMRALLALAERYAAAGQARASLRLVERAAAIDAEACAARLQAARQAAADGPPPGAR